MSESASVGVATGERPVERAGKANVPVDETERFEQVYSLNLDGTVKASNISGDIKVSTWDSPQVRLVATKMAEDRERLKDMELKIESTPGAFSVKVKYRNHDKDDNDGYWRNSGRMSVEYELTVPRTAVLEKISSVSGNISVDGAGNESNVSSVSGDVRASNLGGTAKLSSVSGTVEADFSNVEAGSRIRLSSVSGSVVLMLPSYAGASVRASTVSGKITNDFGLEVDEGKYVGSSMKGTFGDGSVDVKMSTVSGRIKVGKNSVEL
ncbi:MAG: DUF4097 domain-containing protein [Acidobacteriota bacterium]|nr:DUF4097 domain-containing protein [Acidobacteriota bacterium]MDH3529367.1 DUF4097 domain-containing protein [Acidobacteriota bacterium]